MPTKEQLLSKLCAKPYPKNFTKNNLSSLMKKCNCTEDSAGRGSAVKFTKGNKTLIFDLPHPGKDLYKYQIKKIISFLHDIGELNDSEVKK